MAFRRVDFHTGARRRTSSRSPTSSRGGASSSPPWPARCARRRTGRVSRVLFLFLCLRPCGVALATRTWGGYGAVVEAAVRRYIQMKCLALLDGPFVVGHNGRVVRGKNAAHHERRPSPDPSRWPSTTRHRRRRGTSSASSSGRSTARRRRPRTAGCTARATRYFFGVLCRGAGGRPSPSFDPSAGPRRAVACAGAHG